MRKIVLLGPTLVLALGLALTLSAPLASAQPYRHYYYHHHHHRFFRHHHPY